FLIAGWGHGNRRYAAMKFFLFTMTGSAFLFVGLLSVAFLHQHATGQLTFDVRILTAWASTSGSLSLTTAKWLFAAFAVGFAVKVPLVPLHTWLPDAHTDAPTAGSVVLAGVMLKMGTYGFLRFAIPMFPQAAVDLAPILLLLAVIGITYGAILASRWYAVAAATGVILAAVYMLWAVQRAFTGEPDEKNAATRDIGFREICTVAPLLGLSLFLGFYPKPVLDRVQKSVDRLVTQVDMNSDHKTPVINAVAKTCTTDAHGPPQVPD